MKKCSKTNCTNTNVDENGMLNYSEFSKRKSTKDGYRGVCRDCMRLANRNSYSKHKDKTLARQKLRKEENRENYLEITKKASRKYYRKNRESEIARGVKYVKARRKVDPVFKLSGNIRNLIKNSFKRKNVSKRNKTFDILGCSFEELNDHLQATFFKNYGRFKTEADIVHIDHDIPISFAETEEDVVTLNHYTNLQWLLGSDNLDKGIVIQNSKLAKLLLDIEDPDYILQVPVDFTVDFTSSELWLFQKISANYSL